MPIQARWLGTQPACDEVAAARTHQASLEMEQGDDRKLWNRLEFR